MYPGSGLDLADCDLAWIWRAGMWMAWSGWLRSGMDLACFPGVGVYVYSRGTRPGVATLWSPPSPLISATAAAVFLVQEHTLLHAPIYICFTFACTCCGNIYPLSCFGISEFPK